MEIYAQLTSESSNKDIFELRDFMINEKLSGVSIQIKEKETKKSSLGVETMDILQLIFSSTATVALVTGLFKSIKAYIDYRNQLKKLDAEKTKIVLKKVNISGKETSIELHSCSEKERENLIEFMLEK